MSSKNNNRFYLAILILSFFVVLFGVAFNFNILYFNQETILRHWHVLKNGDFFTLKDIRSALDWKTLDALSRTRYIDYFFSILDIRFRFFLFKYLPFHPTFSLTWFFTFFLGGFYLYKAAELLYKDRITGFLSVSLYFLSISHLSGIAQFNRPAKPLSLTFFIFTIYSMISHALKPTDRKLNFILGLLFFGLLIDESMLFSFFCLPVIVAKLNSEKSDYKKILAKEGLVFSFYVFLTLIVIPLFENRMGYPGFNFIRDFLNKQAAESSSLSFILNPFYLISSHVTPFALGWMQVRSFSIVYLILFSIFLYFLQKKLTEKIKKRNFVFLYLLFLFCIFHTILMKKHMAFTIAGSYYYGVLFTVPFVLFLSPILTNIKNLGLKIIFPLFILVVSFHNFLSVNDYCIKIFGNSNWLMNKKSMPINGQITYKMVQNVWKNRNNENALKQIEPQFRYDSYWLFQGVMFYPPMKGFDVKTGRPLFKELFDEKNTTW